MAQLLNWIDYRLLEIEEKADLTQLPEFDMDGCRFVMDSPFEELKWEDADRTVSRRLFERMRCLPRYECGGPTKYEPLDSLQFVEEACKSCDFPQSECPCE